MQGYLNLTKLKKDRKRVGRGGCRGKNSGSGSNGQLSRSGGRAEIRPSFHGGQMPLVRRTPRRGFSNVAFQTLVEIVCLDRIKEKFKDGEKIDKSSLVASGLIKGKRGALIKVLAGKQPSGYNFTIHVDKISGSAMKAVTDSGGTVSLSDQ